MSACRIWIYGAALLVATLCTSDTAFAQSCAMCYTSAAAARSEGIRALQHGILILLLPPLLIFGGICFTAYRRHKRDELTQATEEGMPGRGD